MLTAMAAVIQTRGLTKHYGKVRALDHLTIEVQQGEVVGLVGANGAGKSTTLQSICGLIRPTAGKVALFGQPMPQGLLQAAPRMGVLSEQPSFFENLSARRNLLLLSKLAGFTVNVDRILDLVGLLPAATRKASRMSAGMRQRLGLGAALLNNPELLLLDEPIKGLDSAGARHMDALFRQLSGEMNVTILMSSHDLEEVSEVAVRVAVLDQGKLVTVCPADQLLRYDPRRVRVLLEGEGSAARHLNEQPWVTSAKPFQDRVEVVLAEGSGPHQLTSFLLARGFMVNGVIPRKRTLDDFIEEVNAGKAGAA
jgi:ABC-type multidrug transport system ATPase subunit